MKLDKLIKNIGKYNMFGGGSIRVSGISVDSRKVGKGHVFVAIKGLTIDAHRFIPDAIKKGAVAVVGEEDPKKEWLKKTCYIKVLNSRRALSHFASAWYKHPSKKLKIIGVTGTDGKTTTASIIYWILRQSGKKVGLISTVDAKIGNKTYSTGLHVTNPEPLKLHKFLAEMVQKRCKYGVLEVTSHGLDQERVAGINFDISVLTNITKEHLDYHKTYKRYLETKSKLFNNSKIAILNKEDKSFGKIVKHIRKQTKKLSYETSSLKGALFEVVKNKFPEKYNRLNATAAVLVAKQIGITDKDIINAIKTFPGIIGRLDEIKNNKGVKIYIDFAHTPNALESVLCALKERMRTGKLICVFGCAGERDVVKRRFMPKISAKLADFSIFTAEDPRNEDVQKILKTMSEAVGKIGAEKVKIGHYRNIVYDSKKYYYLTIPERGEAISFAINKLAKKGDTVVICGKGHEKSMSYNGVEYPWSDYQAVQMALQGKIMKIKRK